MSSPSNGIRPRIGAGFRLQWESVQSCHVLLYPEGMVKLNDSAAEIMKRCDGVRTIAAITADIEQTHALLGLENDVLAFVEVAGKQRWLRWD
jgi:pyrroloquinoline quinone biosynthesis protein D